MKLRIFALIAASFFAAMPLAAAPRIEIAVSGDIIEIAVADAPPAAVLQRLAEEAGFSVAGLESLPATPVSLHLRGPLERVLGALLDPASRIATYGADARHLSRLVLLPTNASRSQLVIVAPPPPRELAFDDPAVGASRVGADRLRGEIRGNLGIAIP